MSSQRISGQRIVVTGGAGFIGSHLVRALVEQGADRVIVVDSLRYGDVANLGALGDRVKLVRLTLGTDDTSALAPELAGASALFHLAAEKHNQSKDDPARVFRANVEGTHAIYEAAVRAGVSKIVFSSSLYAYGRVAGEPYSESEVPEPKTVYGISKLAGEHLLRYFAEQHGTEWVALRYLFIYGPKQWAGMGYKSVILKSFERLARGEAPVVFGDGQQALDYVYVDDCVDATLRALQHDVSGRVLNVASGRAVTVRELIDAMIRVSGKPVGAEAGPADWTAGSWRVGDPERAAELLGWRATTSLEDGLERVWRWYLESASG